MGRSVTIHRFLPWAVSSGWRGVAVLAVVAVQITVPFVALVGSEPPTRGGFQMYSGMGGVAAEVVSRSGVSHEVDLQKVTADLRSELDWSQRLPAYLCETNPGAVEIAMTQFDLPEPLEWTVPCAR